MNRQVYLVDDLSKHRLDGTSRVVALAKFLQGHWLLPVNAIIFVEGFEHVINGAEQDLTHLLSRPAALAKFEEVLNKKIYVGKRFGLRRQ